MYFSYFPIIEGILFVRLNAPISGHVSQGDHVYFKCKPGGEEITIKLIPNTDVQFLKQKYSSLNNDVDLYISSNKIPTKDDHTWKYVLFYPLAGLF